MAKRYPRTGKRGAPQSFARKLYEILEDETSDCIFWNADGNAFFVRQVDTFLNDILPKYFKQSKFPSFQRQLNLYGFRKVTKGPDSGAYAHRYFLKGQEQLLHRVRRSAPSSSSSSKNLTPEFTSSPNGSPMSPMSPTSPAQQRSFPPASAIEALQQQLQFPPGLPFPPRTTNPQSGTSYNRSMPSYHHSTTDLGSRFTSPENTCITIKQQPPQISPLNTQAPLSIPSNILTSSKIFSEEPFMVKAEDLAPILENPLSFFEEPRLSTRRPEEDNLVLDLRSQQPPPFPAAAAAAGHPALDFPFGVSLGSFARPTSGTVDDELSELGLSVDTLSGLKDLLEPPPVLGSFDPKMMGHMGGGGGGGFMTMNPGLFMNGGGL